MEQQRVETVSAIGRSGRRVRRAFLVAIPILFLQIPLRRITEPYPAIFMPSGEGVIRTAGQYVGYEQQFYAEDASGRWHAVVIRDVLNTVPENYVPVVVERGFGINKGRDVRYRHLNVAGFPITLQFGRPLTAEQTEETRRWLRARLQETTGLEVERMHILTQKVTTFYDEQPPRQQWQLSDFATIELLPED